MTAPIRAATAADAQRLAALHAQCFAEAWKAGAISALMATPGSFALLAESGDGFILLRAAADEAEILSIGVVAQSRRQGLGSVLLDAAGREALDWGVRHLFLEVAADNAAAQALYAAYGFEAVGRRDSYYRGTDALILKAALPLARRLGNPAKTL